MTDYNYINPNHYKRYPLESIDMMESLFGVEATMNFCLLSAFKYRMRLGSKPNEPLERDLEKEKWYLDKYEELKKRAVKGAKMDYSSLLKDSK